MEKKKSSPAILKFTGFLLVIVLGLSALFLIFLPSILSTPTGKTEFLKMINSRISGTLNIASLKLSWFGNQSLEGLTLHDEKGKLILQCSSVQTSAKLYSLMIKPRHIGQATLTDPLVHLVLDESNRTNIEKAFTPRKNQAAALPLTAGLPTLIFPANTFTFFSSSNLPFYGTLQVINGQLSLNYPGIQTNEFSKLQLTLVIPDSSQPLQLNLTGIISTPDFSAPFTVKTQDNVLVAAGDLFSGKLYGTVELDGKNSTANVRLSNISVQEISQVLIADSNNRNKVRALLGTTLDLTIEKKGRFFDFNLSSTNSKILAKGALDNHQITLREPMTGEFNITPEISQLILKDIQPLFIDAIGSEKPIQFTIDSPGFSVPLPFDMKTLSVSKLSVQPGKIYFRNDGHIAELFDLLKIKSGLGRGQITIWFTPLIIHLKSGILNAERMDGLIENQFTISTWGTVNFMTDRINMTLGLPAESLKKALGLGKLSPSYMLQIPLRGSTGQVSIDWAGAVVKLSTLYAQETVGKNKFLSNLFDIVQKQVIEDDNPPPPPAPPHPWGS